MAKKLTVMIFPEEGADRVKRLCFPRFLIPFFIIALLGSMGLAGYWFARYQGAVGHTPDLKAYENLNNRQLAQIAAFAQRQEEFGSQLARIKGFNERLRVLANLDKPSRQDDIFGVGGRDGATSGPGVRLSATSAERRLQVLQRDLDRLNTEGETERLLQQHLAKFLKSRRSILASTPALWPVRGWVTSGFGTRISPFGQGRHFHSGLDISTRRGTPIIAPAAGVVTFAGRDGGYGRMLAINHGHGIVTRYAHLDKIKTKLGQKVERGQTIATVGNTGRSTGPHLHYEVLLSGVPTNPMYYILD
ncbi:MAG: M23 family metallopeptidase [Proteobacteria bacterium]|nr:M23 family metallopeptidase [Pseudomonadota bacterium]MBU1452706.1 M23 family metallopeptidase [Pseudomonadota bacterium]MBU2468547.1 M23 family metallopeptidase [Pseudomonadota bacterium]MBU2518993.1 M23 family metallopeptidase [Pseudomonadota bacterium]